MMTVQQALDLLNRAETLIPPGGAIFTMQELAEAITTITHVMRHPNIDAATAITNQLRYIKNEDDWDDQIEDITERAIKAALGLSVVPHRFRPVEDGDGECSVQQRDVR